MRVPGKGQYAGVMLRSVDGSRGGWHPIGDCWHQWAGVMLRSVDGSRGGWHPIGDCWHQWAGVMLELGDCPSFTRLGIGG